MKIPELGKDRAYLVIQWPEPPNKFMLLEEIEKKFQSEFKYAERIQIDCLHWRYPIIFHESHS